APAGSPLFPYTTLFRSSWHAEGTSVPATVIGVVDDVRQASLAQETFPEIYVEYHQLLSQLERHPRAAQRQNELAFGFLSFAIQRSEEHTSELQSRENLV